MTCLYNSTALVLDLFVSAQLSTCQIAGAKCRLGDSDYCMAWPTSAHTIYGHQNYVFVLKNYLNMHFDPIAYSSGIYMAQVLGVVEDTGVGVKTLDHIISQSRLLTK